MDNLVYILTRIKRGLKDEHSVYFNNDKTLSSSLSSIGHGGSKRFFVVNNKNLDITINNKSIHDLVIALPNTDVDRCFGHWFQPHDSKIVPMYKLESDISHKLHEFGLLTSNQTSYVIYLMHEDKGLIPVPCYVADSFHFLATKKNMFVIDTKNLDNKSLKNCHHIWQSYNLNLGIYEDGLRLRDHNIDRWKSLCLHYIEHDIPKLYQIWFPTCGDSVNYVVTCENDKPIIRFFGFDFSSKHGGSVIDPYNIDIRKYDEEEYRTYKYGHLRNLIDFILFAEYEYDIGNPVIYHCNSQSDIDQILSILIPEDFKIVQHRKILDNIDIFAKSHVTKQKLMHIDIKMEELNKQIGTSEDVEVKKLLDEYRAQRQLIISDSQKSNCIIA